MGYGDDSKGVEVPVSKKHKRIRFRDLTDAWNKTKPHPIYNNILAMARSVKKPNSLPSNTTDQPPT
jgi:hypothetical protein